MTAYSLSKETGIPQSTISGWTKGKNIPSGQSLKKLAGYFGITSGSLLAEDDVAKQSATENRYDILKYEAAQSTEAQRLAELYDGGDEMTVVTFKTLLAMDEQARATILSTLRMFAENANNAADAVTAKPEPPSGARSSTKKTPSAQRETGRKAIVGEAAAGTPITVLPDTDDITISIPSKYLSEGFIIVKARGESMIGANIKSGDFCVFQIDAPQYAGDVMLVQIEGDTDLPEGTIKRVFFNGKTVELRSENPEYPPMNIPPTA